MSEIDKDQEFEEEEEPVFGDQEDPIDASLPILRVNGLEITDKHLCALLFDAEQKSRTADVFVGKTTVPLSESVTICVQNNVIQLKLSQPLLWTFIVPHCFSFGMRYATRKFGAIDFPCVNPKATLRIYSESITCNGARKISDAVFWLQRILTILGSLKDNIGVRPYAGIHCKVVRLVNIVASVNVGVAVDLEKLGSVPHVKYQPMEWPNAKISMKDIDAKRYEHTRVVALISADGNLVISGARSREELVSVYADVLPYMLSYTVQSRTKTIDNQRRAEKDVKNVQKLPANSLAIITVRHVFLQDEQNMVAKMQSSALVPRESALSSLSKLDAGQTVAKNIMVLQSFEAKRKQDEADLIESISTQTEHKKTKLLSSKETAALVAMHGFEYDD